MKESRFPESVFVLTADDLVSRKWGNCVRSCRGGHEVCKGGVGCAGTWLGINFGYSVAAVDPDPGSRPGIKLYKSVPEEIRRLFVAVARVTEPGLTSYWPDALKWASVPHINDSWAAEASPELIARVFNRTMALLGYTEGNYAEANRWAAANRRNPKLRNYVKAALASNPGPGVRRVITEAA